MWKSAVAPQFGSLTGAGRARGFSGSCILVFALIFCLLAFPLPARDAAANPLDPQVQAGTVGFSESGGQLNVLQSSATAIIDWRSFSIAAGETTRFHQPSTDAILAAAGVARISSSLDLKWL